MHFFDKLSRVKENIEMAFKVRRIKGLFIGGGALYEMGWVASKKSNAIVDKDNNPIPWYTFNAVCFLKERLKDNMDIFEYGCGYSTRFYAKHAKSVDFVEHDREWFRITEEFFKKNNKVKGYCFQNSEQYCNAVTLSKKRYDIIVVDGLDECREKCLKKATDSIKENGVIILDNSERIAYKAGIDYLLKSGYKKIDFWGIAVGNWGITCTSLFYKQDNLFGI